MAIGKGYGSAADRTYRVAYNDRTIHPFQPLTPSAIVDDSVLRRHHRRPTPDEYLQPNVVA
ncbi:hypothetical protein JCM18909_2020 [Cutibacterium acnes JCM 18909]|nr:hypothetical protein JCM18909_2020 [Cutibacterium acnes JCM 18909]